MLAESVDTIATTTTSKIHLLIPSLKCDLTWFITLFTGSGSGKDGDSSGTNSGGNYGSSELLLSRHQELNNL